MLALHHHDAGDGVHALDDIAIAGRAMDEKIADLDEYGSAHANFHSFMRPQAQLRVFSIPTLASQGMGIGGVYPQACW